MIARAGPPDVAAMPGGGVVVSWVQPVSTPGRVGEVVVVATCDPGGAFTVCGARGRCRSDEVLDTEVVVDDAGTTTVLFAARTVRGLARRTP